MINIQPQRCLARRLCTGLGSIAHRSVTPVNIATSSETTWPRPHLRPHPPSLFSAFFGAFAFLLVPSRLLLYSVWFPGCNGLRATGGCHFFHYLVCIVQLHVTKMAADAHVFISSDIVIFSQTTIMQADDVQPCSPRDAWIITMVINYSSMQKFVHRLGVTPAVWRRR